MKRYFLIGMLCSILLGCQESETANMEVIDEVVIPDETDELVDNTSKYVEKYETLNNFFGLRIHKIDVILDDYAVESLTRAPDEYAHATLRLDTEGYQDVGFRLKGGAGSFIPLAGTEDHERVGASSKSAFIIDFNKWVSGEDHMGLKKLTANNMVQDFSYIHEYLKKTRTHT